MRIDKYLKVTRLIKRRTVAKEACEAGRILVNGKEEKPGYNVSIGDEIEINLGARPLKVRVVEIAEHVKKEAAPDFYEIIN